MAAQENSTATSPSTQPIGTVVTLTGSVTATGSDGVARTLRAGDPVYADDSLQTGGTSSVAVEFVDGTQLVLGRDSRAVLDSEVFDAASDENAEDAVASMSAIQEAILAGQDPAAILEPPAAGGIPGDGEGHSFVRVDRTGEQGEVDSGFDTEGLELLFSEPPEPLLEVNDPPIALDDALSTTEDTALTIDPSTLLANDSDPDGNALQITGVANAVNGTVEAVFGEDGAVTSIVFTPAQDFNGEAQFEYTVSDGLASDTAIAEVAVQPVNDPPVASGEALSTAEDTALTIDPSSLLANDTDVDGDVLRITGVGDAVNGTVEAVFGEDGVVTSIVFTPAENYHGEAQFAYTVSDGQASDTAIVAVTVGTANDAPVVLGETLTPVEGTSLGALSTAEDTALTIDPSSLLANDTDVDGDVLRITGVGDAVNGTVEAVTDADGAVTSIVFTPAENYHGEAQFGYTVSDGEASDSAIAEVMVEPVNDAPVANGEALSTAEDTALTIDPSSLLANDMDVDGDVLRITGVGDAVNGTVEAVTDADGAVTSIVFTPAENYHGEAQFGYTVSDGEASDSAIAEVTVEPVNDAPVANGEALSTAEDTALTVEASSLLANDTDVDGDVLRITGVGDAVNGTVEAVTDADGVVTSIVFTPAENYHGEAQFGYTVSDGEASDSAIAEVTVEPVNDAPVANGEALSTAEDTALTIDPSSLLANDTDVDGDVLRITGVGDAVNGTVEAVTDAGGAVTSIVFTPAENYHGEAQFGYTVSDGEASDSAIAEVMVEPVNDAPVANGEALSTAEDTALTIDPSSLLANDTDVDGDVLRITGVGDAVNGTVEAVTGADGAVTSIVFTPTENYHGEAQFGYTVSDGEASDSAIAEVMVEPVNDAPVANGEALSTAEDTALTIDPLSLLANDTDVDGDVLRITGVGDAVNGTVEAVTGADGAVTSIVFTPAENYHGEAQFGYTVSDGEASDSAIAEVMVEPVNDAPVADPVLADVDAPVLGLSASLGNVVFIKALEVGGGLDGDIAVLESPATLGGEDVETPEGSLSFTLTSLPAFGAVYIDYGANDPTGSDWVKVIAADDPAFSFSTADRLFWVATDADPSPIDPLPGESHTVGGAGADRGDWEQDGVALSATDLAGQAGEVTFHANGAGVAGGDRVPGQINDGFGQSDGASENLIVDFSRSAAAATVTVSNLIPNERGGEIGVVTAVHNGVEVGSWTFGKPGTGADIEFDLTRGGVGTFGMPEGVIFDRLVFSATETAGGIGFEGDRDSSDYYLREITFTSEAQTRYPDNVAIDYRVTDSDGLSSGPASVVIALPEDALIGGSGGDELVGGAGDDYVVGLDGDDILDGGDGDDILVGGAGDDGFLGGANDDVLDGGDGHDLLLAGSGNDTLEGGTGNDILVGESGQDILNGGAGDDLLFGDAGDDQLVAGTGFDTVTGGSGSDLFRVAVNDTADDLFDDFDSAHDVLDLRDLLSDYDPTTDELSDFVQVDGVDVRVDASGSGDFAGDSAVVATFGVFSSVGSNVTVVYNGDGDISVLPVI